MSNKKVKKIVVLATGGTIAGLAPDPQRPADYQAGVLPVTDLLPKHLNADLTLVTEQVAQLDSKDMTHEVWHRLALRCAVHLADPWVQGLVITHGTDTAEETAFFLQSVLRPSKPVALTCAMRPANAPDADGPENLRQALQWAQTMSVPQVVLVCAGQAHAAQRVQKVFSDGLNAFSSGPEGPMASHRSGQWGLHHGPEPHPWSAPSASALPPPQDWPEVSLLFSHAGADGAEVRCRWGQSNRLRGLVVAATGMGTLHVALAEALLEAQQRGVEVWVASRCTWGRVGSLSAFNSAGTLSPVKARIALMLSLMQT